MSTRSTTHFLSGSKVHAIVYRHPDGYPAGHGADLLRFFDDVRAQTSDTRFTDPEYLAAKLVVWLADHFRTGYRFDSTDGTTSTYRKDLLDFTSVGVVLEDPADIEYRYVVDCSVMVDGRPRVSVFDVLDDNQPIGEIASVLAILS